MRKKLTLMMVALVAVAAFALQTSFRALNDATATATAEDWNITAGAYSLLGNAEQSLAGQTAQVNIDGNNVTLSVTVSSINVSLTGTKSGSTVTFPMPQTVMGQYYLVGSNTAQTTVSDIVFAYDETNQKLTQTTERIVVSQSSSAITSPMGYIKGVVLENPNGGSGDGMTDVLTWDGLGLNATNSNYTDFSGKTFSSPAVYAGNASSGTGKYIQLRSKNNAGIITTTSGGKVKSVKVEFNEGTTDRAVSIYGKNSAYTATSELYSANTQGDLLGEIAADANTNIVTVSGDYAYVGIRSKDGAIYIDKITIQWEESATPVQPDYYILGEGFEGLSWTASADNRMEAAQTTAGYTKTFENVSINASANAPVTIYYKFKSSTGTWYPGGENLNYVIRESGKYTIQFSFDPASYNDNNPYGAQEVTVTKTGEADPVENTYYVAGAVGDVTNTGADVLFGTGWAVLEANKLTVVDGSTTGFPTKVYENVILPQGNIYYKIVIDDGTTQTWVPDLNVEKVVPETAKYKVTVTYDLTTEMPSMELEKTADIASVANIAALTELANNALFAFTGEALVVAKPTAKYVYIKDNTGSSLIYDSNGNKTEAAEPGKTLAANWTGKVNIYKNLFEAVPDNALVVKAGDAVDVTYDAVDLGYVNADHVNEVVMLKGVTYSEIGTSGNARNFTITKGDAVVAGFNQFAISFDAPVEGKTYDIVGAISRFNDNIQFQPITITEAQEVLEPVVWPDGVEGETWSITTTAAQTGGATQNIENEPCRVAYLADAAEAYLQAPFTLQGRQFVVTLKGSVDANKNVTIPMGQLVAQDPTQGLSAYIFAKNADQEFDDVVLTYSETAEKLSLKYEGNIYLYLTGDPGSTDVPVFTLTNTEVFKEIEASEEDGYYVVGNMTEWTPNADYKMTKNEAAETEEYMFTMDLTTTSQFKVVKVEDGEQTWYPDGMGNNYGENGEITADGEYTIYFRPNADGGDDWFYNVIYVAASAEPLPELPGDVIWSSNTPVVLPANWDGAAAPHVAAEKFADANAGDVLHIAVQDVTPSSLWSAQVAPYADNVWAQIENGFPVGTGDIPEAYFPITGDMLRLLKANGLIIFGVGYSTRLATLERGVYEGSEYSVWVGDKTLTWTQATVDKLHLNNAGVEAGMTLKLSYEATGNPNIQLVYGWGAGENYGQVTYGDGFATLEITEDMIENLKTKGVIVNADGIRLKQVELLPAEEPVPENFYFIGDSQDWNLADMPAFTKDETTGNFTYEVTVESDFYFALSDVATFETPGAGATEEQWNNTWADFNETHRYATAEGNPVQIVAGQPMQLIKCGGTLVIKDLGIYTITVTPEMEISITKTGEVTPQTDMIYLIGDPNQWNRENPTEMNVDAATGNYYFEVETESNFYFAITDKVLTAEEAAADADWSDYNANHRWAIGEGDIIATLDEEIQLQKVNGTIVLQPGSYTIIITPDLKMIITGEGTQLTPDYYVVGESTQLGLEWGVVEANKMELLPARTSQDEIYVKKYENVEFTAGDVIKFKVGASTNGTDISTWYPEGMGNEYTAEISMDGTYKVTFTFNATQSTTEDPVIDINIESESNPELNGDWIFWTEDDVCAQGSAEALYGTEDFYVSLVDTDGKHAVDANNAYFGDATQQIKFTHRFKTGGKSGAKNSMTLTIPSDGKLSVYVRTGSNDATNRNLVLTQDENELYNQVVQEADAIQVAPEDLNVVNPAKADGDPVKVYPIITVDVVAGELSVGYPTGSLNFYAFQFVSETTGIVNIMPEQQGFDESLPAYNLQGQRVTKSYRGIVIQNGRKFMNK